MNKQNSNGQFAEFYEQVEPFLLEPAEAPDAQLDRRALTSPMNGQRGGRPRMPYGAIADAFAEEHRDRGILVIRRYQGQWYRFDGHFYRSLSQDDIASLVMAFIRRHPMAGDSKNCRDSVIVNLEASDLSGMPSTAVIPCRLDAAYTPLPGYFALRNAVVNTYGLADAIRNGRQPSREDVMPTSPEIFVSSATDYDHDPTATCPTFMTYLLGVQPDPEAQDFIQMLMGLALVRDLNFNVFFVLLGDGGTGKSVLIKILRALAGVDNVCCLPLAGFGHKFALWQLTQCRLNLVGDMPTETENGMSLAKVEGMLKDVVDGGLVSCEKKGQDIYSDAAIAINIFATNSMFRFADRSRGIWDRLRIVPFDQRFRGSDSEVHGLAEKIIAAEMPGVFNFALAGLAKVTQLTRFPEHPGGLAVKAKHQDACDVDALFLREHVELADDSHSIRSRALYDGYRSWAKDNGFHSRSSNNFYESVTRIFGLEKIKVRWSDNSYTWRFVGLAWKERIHPAENYVCN